MIITLKKYGIIYLALIAVILLFFIWQNNSITVTKYTYKTSDSDLSGLKILQLSDLHGKTFGKRLIKQVKRENPDLIVITGDMIDRDGFDVKDMKTFVSGLTDIAPVYYINGNHEANNKYFASLSDILNELQVTYLDNESVDIKYNESTVNLIGISDPKFSKKGYTKEFIQNFIKSDTLNILLAHHPEMIDIYAESGADIVFTGHAHGGQIILPFIGGLIAPNQGFLPEYTEGMHKKHNTTMVISRGLGNSIIKIRLFNRPEIVVFNIE